MVGLDAAGKTTILYKLKVRGAHTFARVERERTRLCVCTAAADGAVPRGVTWLTSPCPPSRLPCRSWERS